MRTTPRFIKLLAATIAILLAAQGVVLATTVRRNGGPLTALRTATADGFDTTGSPNYRLIPGMGVSIGVPQGQRTQLVITFSGETSCDDVTVDEVEYCLVAVLVDGSPASPGDVIFDNSHDGASFESNSMQFVTGPLAAGSHTVRVMYRVDTGTGGSDAVFSVGYRTLTVLRSRV